MTASKTKWLSQCGQYSSLALSQHLDQQRRFLWLHIRILKLSRILAKRLFALFANEGHVEGLQKGVVALLGMALGAIEPLLAWPILSIFAGVSTSGRTYSRASGWRPGRSRRVCYREASVSRLLGKGIAAFCLLYERVLTT